MIYSYSQLSHYLACPRRYRYRYVEGWQERETRAEMVFGRAFEAALGALFRRQDPGATLFEEWAAHKDVGLHFAAGDSWAKMLEQGTKLLEFFAQQDRIEIRRPRHNLQVKITKQLSSTRQFVGYVDALGYLDGRRCVIDWKTTSARYPEKPEGLLALDPQLVCYSWLTEEPEVAFVVFVRKRLPEIQYLRASISERQRREFGQLVADTVEQIEAGQFLPRTGIRFPQNGCTHCTFLGLCLEQPPLAEAHLIRRVGEDLAWLDQIEG